MGMMLIDLAITPLNNPRLVRALSLIVIVGCTRCSLLTGNDH